MGGVAIDPPVETSVMPTAPIGHQRFGSGRSVDETLQHPVLPHHNDGRPCQRQGNVWPRRLALLATIYARSVTWRSRTKQWQCEANDRPAMFAIFRPDLAAVGFDDGACDR